MRDLSLFLIVGGMSLAAWYRPWLGALGLIFVAFLHPQSWGGPLTSALPVYAFLVAVTLISSGRALWRSPGELQWPPRDWRLAVFFLLWAYMLFTTFHATAYYSAWERLFDVSKMFAPLLLMLIIVNTRAKLAFFLAAIALSVGLIAFKGGYWAVMTGFTDRVMGPPRSDLADNNHFAVATIMAVPLLALWRRRYAVGALRHVLALAIALCVLAALSSWSRGAVLSLSVTLLALALTSRRKLIALPLMAALLAFAFSSVPETWFERIESIATYEQDQSASNRVIVWQRGIERAQERPWTGVGFRGWIFMTIGAGRRDWHSAYIQVLAEHGFVAFGLWCLLLFGSIAALLSGPGVRERRGGVWGRDEATFVAIALIGYAVGAAFLSVAYWGLLYTLIFAGILISHLATGNPVILRRTFLADMRLWPWAKKIHRGRVMVESTTSEAHHPLAAQRATIRSPAPS